MGLETEVLLLSTTYVSLLQAHTLTQFALLTEQLKGQCKAGAQLNLKIELKVFLIV